MTRERTPIDRLIQPAAERVAAAGAYFTKSEVVRVVTDNKKVRALLADLRSRHGAWKVDQLVTRYIEKRVSEVLQMRDGNHVRIYECYAVGSGERRWMPIRAMTADTLRLVMQETRTQERQLHIKSAGYEHFLKELEKLGAGATVDDVYDTVIDRIRAYRASA